MWWNDETRIKLFTAAFAEFRNGEFNRPFPPLSILTLSISIASPFVFWPS